MKWKWAEGESVFGEFLQLKSCFILFSYCASADYVRKDTE